MIAMLKPLMVQLQRFFIPIMIGLLLWAVWRTVVKKDFAVGLALYLALVLVVDSYLISGIFVPGMPKGSIKFSEVCALFLMLSRPAKPQTSIMRLLVVGLVATYFTLLFASVFRSEFVLSGLFEFRRWMIPQIVAFVVASRGFNGPQDYQRFFLCLTALFLMIAAFTFYDLFFERVILKSVMLDHGIYWFNRGKNRFGSFFMNPNYLGAFIVLVFPAAFVWTALEKRHRVYAWVGLLALIFSLVETQSRGAVLAFGIALLLLVVGPAGDLTRRRRIAFLVVGAIAFGVFMPGGYTKALKRFDTVSMEMETAEGRSRKTTWEYTMRMIGNHPVAGIGFGEKQFILFMKDYGFEGEFGAEALDAPHNSYLQVGVYAGVPALLALLLFNVLVLARAMLRAIFSKASHETATGFGLAVGSLGFLACIFTDLQLFTPHVGATYFVFQGLLLSLVTKPIEATVAEPAWSGAPLSAYLAPPVGPRTARTMVQQ